MTQESKKLFVRELKELLGKYDVNIQFVCDPCSDTYGIYDAGMAVYENRTDKKVLRVHGWYMDKDNIKVQ